MKKIFNKRGQEGFTLIEVMMALIILGIGIMSIAALQTRNMTMNNSSKRQNDGYTAAMFHVEQLITAPYATSPLLAVGGPYNRVSGPYNVVWNVADNQANINNSLLINVVVNWNNQPVSTLNFTRTQESF